MTDYILTSSSTDALELPDAVREQARAMAGELAVQLVTDRLAVLVAAAHAVEGYCDRGFWPGVNGAARESRSEIEFSGCCDVAIVPELPDTSGTITVVSVKRWHDDSDCYEDVAYKLRPSNRLRVQDEGNYQLVSTFLPDDPAPSVAIEAAARAYSFWTQHRPSGRSLAESGSYEAPRLQGAIQRSGAAELLRHLRRYRA